MFHCENIDKGILMQLLQIISIQETLEHFSINSLDMLDCTSVTELLFEFKRIKTIEIIWHYLSNEYEDDELEEWKLEIKQFNKKMKMKHSQIDIYIRYREKSD